MPFCLPESYASYVAEPAVQTAVDHILGSKLLKVPDGLDWGQLPDLHAADLGAHQVRCDYASALQGLWDGVWGKAIDEAGIGERLKAWSISDTADWYGLGFDAISLWRNGVFARAYTRDEFWIGLGVSLDLREARLCLWFGNENDEDLADGLLSQDDWDPELDEYYGYWSKKNLARIEVGCVPLKRLKAAAVKALRRLR